MVQRSQNSGSTARWGDNVILADFGQRRRKEGAGATAERAAEVEPGDSWVGAEVLKAARLRSDSGRMARGREYFRNGHVRSVELEENKLLALVQGSQPGPFEVHMGLRALGRRRREFIAAEIDAEPSILRELMRGGAPPVEIASMLLRADQLSFRGCSCPDKAKVCKHSVAVAYQLAEMFSRDPLALLRWRGIQIDERVAQQVRGRRSTPGGVAGAAEQDAAAKVKQDSQPLDQEEFWGSEATRVQWNPLTSESGLEQGNKASLMQALRSISWTSVDQLEAMHELEISFEAIMDDSGRFDPAPWLTGGAGAAEGEER